MELDKMFQHSEMLFWHAHINAGRKKTHSVNDIVEIKFYEKVVMNCSCYELHGEKKEWL